MELPSEAHPLNSDTVKFFPLGGLGEIGMNCFALEQAGDVLVVDCGATFPDDDVGVDLIVPDFSWLWERQAHLRGLFITHAHEDHIGAVPHFLRGMGREIPVFAPPHASALLAARLKEQKLDPSCLCVVRPGERYHVGSFVVEPISVAHSIVDATALCIESHAGRIIHTADFNLDLEQPAGALTDSGRLKQLGDDGVSLLLSDSTNVDVEERLHSEGDVYRELIRQVNRAPRRIVLSLFSSNVHRLMAAFEAAEKTGRKLCFLGRSLTRQVSISSELGYLKYKSDALVSTDDLKNLRPEETLIVAGGTQGEAASALRRLSQDAHASVTLEVGDRVLLSARTIPGNERAVHAMVGDFLRRGIEVITPRDVPGVHTSGHASRSELRQMLRWVRPKSFIPVHGTMHHLLKHEALARDEGVATTALVENGTGVTLLSSGRLEKSAPLVQSQVRLVGGGEILSARERRKRTDLARKGALLVSVLVNERGESLELVRMTSWGVPGVDEDENALQVLRSAALKVMHERAALRGLGLQEALGRTLRSVVLEMSGTRPIVSVHVLTAPPGGPV